MPLPRSRCSSSSSGTTSQSGHGDRSASGAGSSALWKISSAQIICIHVVPCLERVLITMSPGRGSNANHRALSCSTDQ
jgi:hypothetical protein